MKDRAPSFTRHVLAHGAVVANKFWYGDGSPFLGPSFTAKKTADRQDEIIALILKAAKKAEKTEDKQLANAFHDLADKLYNCHPRHRCGSLACPKCARAFQKAKTAAQETVISKMQKSRPKKQLVFVTIVPKGKTFSPGKFSRIDIIKANRWLKDTLKPIGKRIIVGSADLGWESRRGGSYIQLHWHLALCTNNPDRIEKKLKATFKRGMKYERHIDVKVARDNGFLPYVNKVIKLPDLLRRNRTHLPELLLVLNRTEPLDLLVFTQLRLSAQEGRLLLRPI